MTTRQLLMKTYPFIAAKMLLGGLMIVLSTIWLVLLLSLGWLIHEMVMVILFAVWIGSLRFIYAVLMRIGGYFIKAGHIAVVVEAYQNGEIPEHQLAFGKLTVQNRFLASGVYFVVDELMSSAIRQIFKKTQKLFDKLEFIPGISMISVFVQGFFRIFLGCIDECCLGWTFINQDQNPFKSAADGVLIYAQNWKKMIEHAASACMKMFLLTLISTFCIFVPTALMFKLMNLSGFGAFLLSVFLAWCIKVSLFDSWVMIETMGIYMNCAASTQLGFDLYACFSEISPSFKELLEKENETRSNICPECNFNIAVKTRYCPNCGFKIAE